MTYPTPAEIRAARGLAGLTQQQAIELVHQSGNRTWRAYEAGSLKMHPSAWELFLLKTGQHPTLALTAKAEACA